MKPNYEGFRKEAASKKLIYAVRGDAIGNQPCFQLGLSNGQIYAPANPENTLKLLTTARQFAVSEGFGEHNELLQLALRRASLDAPGFVYWRGDYTPQSDQDKWLTLGAWLAEKGHPYRPNQRQFSVEVDGKEYTTDVTDDTYMWFQDGVTMRKQTLPIVLAAVVKKYGTLSEESLTAYMDEQWVF